MEPRNIPVSMVEALDQLCCRCPTSENTKRYLFQMFAGVSRPSRMSLFAEMNPEQVVKLFELAADCICPRDPREENKRPPS